MRIALLVLLLGVPARGQAALRTVDPWIRYQGDITAGSTAYIPLQNPGASPVVVRGVTCEHIRLVLMREPMRGGTGARTLVTRDSLVIPAGDRLEMRPGGRHLMLLGLARPLNVGERAVCTIRTSVGDVVVRVPIRTS